MSLQTCKTCNTYYFLDSMSPSHTCPPKWIICCEANGYDYDESTEFASCAENAATQWAARHDSETAEYSIVSGCAEIVAVRQVGTPFEESIWLEVSGESQPRYDACFPDDDYLESARAAAAKDRQA